MPKGVYPHTHVKPKVYPADMVERVRDLYGSGMTQVEVAAELGVSQKVVWNLMRNHGITARPRIKRDQAGPKNDTWKGGTSITTGGYRVVRAPDHPRAGQAGYVFEHVLIVEQELGRRLEWHGPGHPDSEIVHHLNGDKLDNRPENLTVTSFREHLEHHRDSVTGQNEGTS